MESVSPSSPGWARELRLRAVSGLALAAATLAITWSGRWPFAVLVLLVGLIVNWEWGRVVRKAGLDATFYATAAALVLATALVAGGRPGLGLLALGAGALAAGLLAPGGLSRPAAVGVLYAGLPAVALVWLRGGGRGLEAILLLLLVVWATDTGAFIAGRTIGGPRLWARVSPNKTWAGLGGGVMAGGIVAWAFARAIGSASPGLVLVLGMVLAAVSQAGDLLESAIKRAYGVKDASSLIPGHGGFMDRVDGLILAAGAAAFYALLVDPAAPAAALLMLR
jgi:phosphatidate cytidylyltransferase